jgi:hypothetical protein
MSNKTQIAEANNKSRRMATATGWKKRFAVIGTALVASAGVLIYTVLAVVPQPVLKIAALGSNQFSITITNGVNTNYTLFWTPLLGDSLNYPWQVLGIGTVGQTNFTVIGGEWPVGFFEMLVGADRDGDGIPEWQDAQPLNTNVGILTITIDSPVNGSTVD